MASGVNFMISPHSPHLMQIPEEFEQLLDIYKAKKPKRILEIGVANGGTLYHWIRFAPPNATIVAVDLQLPWEVMDDTDEDFDIAIIGIEGNSQHSSIANQVKQHAPFDFIFIDGSHDFDDVRSDWETYGQMMAAAKSIVVFHDIAHHFRPGFNSDVEFVWEEIKNQGYTCAEIIAEPLQGWGGIGVVQL